MASGQEIIEKLKTAKTSLKRRYSVTDIALFGPYSRGEEKDGDLVDILVTLDRPIGIRFVDLEDELEQLLQKKVYVAQRKGMEPKYLKTIKKELIHV